MKKNKILLLIIVILLQSCQNEVPQKSEKIVPIVELRENFCYINKIEKIDDKVVLTVDLIEYAKTIELDSTIELSNIIELPNGFSYFNKEVKLVEVELVNNSKIILQTFSYSKEGNFNFNQAVTLGEFVKEYNNSEALPFKFSPYKILLNKDNVVALIEIYIP